MHCGFVSERAKYLRVKLLKSLFTRCTFFLRHLLPFYTTSLSNYLLHLLRHRQNCFHQFNSEENKILVIAHTFFILFRAQQLIASVHL